VELISNPATVEFVFKPGTKVYQINNANFTIILLADTYANGTTYNFKEIARVLGK
jgi:hypothetical protein